MNPRLIPVRSLPHRPGDAWVGIVSGSFGAGHDAAAREIALRLEARGYAVRTWDIVDLMPGLMGRALRGTYLRQIRSAPRSWAWLLGGLERHDRVAGLIARAVSSGSSALLEKVVGDPPVTVVSTHPFASQALGELRASGRLDVPAVTYLTDLSVHRLWVHQSVDLHLALHPLAAAEAEGLGAGTTRVVRPLAPAGFTPARDRAVARERARSTLGLPQDQPLVLVTGGSLGIGDLELAALDVSRTGLALPVVLCGRNEQLRRRLRGMAGVVALDWVDDMRVVYNAVDAVVQNAGGFTSLEARAMDVPTLTYRCIAGHGESNAEALDLAGWVPWVHSQSGLAAALSGALALTRLPRAEEAGLEVVDAMLPAFPLTARLAAATA